MNIIRKKIVFEIAALKWYKIASNHPMNQLNGIMKCNCLVRVSLKIMFAVVSVQRKKKKKLIFISPWFESRAAKPI